MPDRGPATQDLTTLAGVKLGNYRLERLVGRGRMGVVYLAKDEALLRPTAIKVLSWRLAEAKGHDPVQWFLAEARLVARINHPRVVQIYGAARHGDYCYIAMEYVPGQSAEAMVAREPMPPDLATDVVIQAASALHAAHGSGVVHRDVKPANLLVGAGGVTKLGDFGMALGPAEVRIGNAHVRVGTPYYTAPEIWRGEAATPASDIYSLGATYFHLLTARPPYPGPDVPAVEQAHLRAPVPDPRELVGALPASCVALVQRALAKHPRERHASAQELLFEARRAMQDLTALPTRAPAAARGALARGSGASPGLPPATGPLAEVLGFVRQPFSDVDAASLAALAEPVAAARERIAECVDDEGTPVFAVVGAGGSGAAALCRSVAAELSRSRLVVTVSLAGGADGRTLLLRLCAAAGAEDAREDLEALVARLGEERLRQGAPPLVVIEGVGPQPPSAAGLAAIVGAAIWTRSFKVLLSGGPGLVEGLARAGVDFRGERVPELPVPPLDRDQIPPYLRGWLEATLAPAAPPIIVTPDALLLLALRSEGALERVNCIAENMLLLAAAERRRTLCSWHAWTAPDRERWSASPGAALPGRPADWPPPEVVDVIDACRRGAGMPPWPRGAVQRADRGAGHG
jgi:type II secretory pathway predicted ATPase ExeA